MLAAVDKNDVDAFVPTSHAPLTRKLPVYLHVERRDEDSVESAKLIQYLLFQPGPKRSMHESASSIRLRFSPSWSFARFS